jgi:5-methylcytosine-specific restriction endonuclease McrA
MPTNDPLTKHCNACDTTKPLGEFYRASGRPGGFAAFCKACTAKKKRGEPVHSVKALARATLAKEGKKRCTKCGEVKRIVEFRTQARQQAEYPTSWCIECLNNLSREMMREYVKDPVKREQMREKDHRRWREVIKASPVLLTKNRMRGREYAATPMGREKSKLRNREWVAANPARAKANHDRWKEQHPDRIREAKRAYNERNRELVLVRSVNLKHMRRYRMAAQGGTIANTMTTVHALMAREFWLNRCCYCGEHVPPKDTRAGFDHVLPISQGGAHSPGNVAVCCKRCNYRKNKTVPDESILERLMSQLERFAKAMPAWSFERRDGARLGGRKDMMRALADEVRGKGRPLGITWRFGEPVVI